MAYNEVSSGAISPTILGANVYAYLQNGADTATGFVSGNHLGSGVQPALNIVMDTPGGIVSYSALVADIQAQTNPFLVTGGALGTPASGTATNLTGLPISTGVSGLGTGVAASLAIAVNTANGSARLDGSGFVPQANLASRAATASVVAAPVAPASTSVFAMQGLAGVITPTTSGRIWITISGTIVAPSSTVVDNGISYQISTGTGTAPVNAATLTGTQVGPVQTYTSAIAPTAAADVHVPFSVTYQVTGLTLGTPVWIDLAAKSITTVSAMGLAAVGVVAVEF